MEEMKVQQEEQEIDLLEVFCVLWNKARILLLSLIVGVVLAGIVTYAMGTIESASAAPVTPLYEATSIICAFSVNTDFESYLMELELSSSLAADFRILGTTREVVESALDACGLEIAYENIVGSILVICTTPHMLQITVTNADPQLAAQLSNAVGDQLKLKVAEIMGISVPATVEYASVPKNPINSTAPVNTANANLKRNCILGGGAFLVLAAGAVLVDYFLRDSFKEKVAAIRRKQQDCEQAKQAK